MESIERDTLPERMETAIRNFREALAARDAARAKFCSECGEDMDFEPKDLTCDDNFGTHTVAKAGWGCPGCGHHEEPERFDTANEI